MALVSEKVLTLEELVKMGKLEDTVNIQLSEFKKRNEPSNEKNEINQVNRKNTKRWEKKEGHGSKAREKYEKETEKKCFNCGRKFPHEKSCPAKGQKCRSCGKFDHFESCCRSKKIKQVHGTNESGSENEYGIWNVRAQFRSLVMAVKNFFMPMITLFMCGISLGFTVDTGAQVNIIDERSYNKLRFKPKLVKSKTKLFGYGNENCIETIGTFKTRVKYSGQYKSIHFVVTKGNYGNLLGYKSSVELGIMNEIKMVELEKKEPGLDGYRHRYPKLFSGKVGLLKDHEVKLHIDESVKPVQGKLRPVPFHMRPLVEAEIKKMLEDDIIEPVNGPTPWVSPIVPVPKPDKPHELRICTDAREANKAILRSRHTCPTVEDLALRLNGAKFISKFDLRSGYHQLLLSESSRYITAFCTHLGIFQYKRLNFGINAAAEIFQKTIEQVLAGLDGVLNFSDDIIVFGTDQKEHEERL